MFWIAMITAVGATGVNYVLYRRRAISKCIASDRNHWDLKANDLARLIFYIPFMSLGDRAVVKNSLDCICVVTMAGHQKVGVVPIAKMSISRRRVEKSLERWQIYRCLWVGLTFCLAFIFSYLTMYLITL
jgi:hypothetical protein